MSDTMIAEPEAFEDEFETALPAAELSTKRKRTVNYGFEVVDELPENAAGTKAAGKRGQPGWRGRFEQVVAAYEAGELPLDAEGRSRWVVLARYGTKSGAATALNAVKKRQAAAAEDADVEPAVPRAWAFEIETRRPASGGSILAARCWPK